jgi:methionine aminotransferase
MQSKLPDVGVTIFTVMSALAAEHGAINLSQGFPDFAIDAALVDLVDRHMREGRNQYAPMQGVMLLRERIAEKARLLYSCTYDPETEICVTSGATEALYAAVASAIRPGDEALLIEPAYDSYGPAVLLSGGVPVFCQMRYPGYTIDWDQVRDSITEKTRLLFLNSPHNPTGSVLGPDDIAALTAIVSGTGIIIISDEVYEHIIFDGRRHESMARYPELRERSFVIGSFGKTCHATGWKVGYAMGPRVLMQEFIKVHQYLTFATCTPIQHALADYLANSAAYLSLAGFYEKKRDLFRRSLGGSRFTCMPSCGTYFQMLDYTGITDEPDVTFAKRLAAEHRVAAIPPSVFYDRKQDNRTLRFCFAKRNETLLEAAERLCRI